MAQELQINASRCHSSLFVNNEVNTLIFNRVFNNSVCMSANDVSHIHKWNLESVAERRVIDFFGNIHQFWCREI